MSHASQTLQCRPSGSKQYPKGVVPMNIAFVGSSRSLILRAAKTLALTSGLAMAASIASAQSFTGLGFFTDPPVAGTESYARRSQAS